MIKNRNFERWDSQLYIDNESKIVESSIIRLVKSNNKKVLANIVNSTNISANLSLFIEKNSSYMNYWEYLINTPVWLEMQPLDYFVVIEKREVNEDYDDAFLVHMVNKISELKYYIYKNEDWDILYFRNPFYEWNIINELSETYEKVNDIWAHRKSWDTLEEIPEYNHRLSEELSRLWFRAFDPNEASKEFRLQMKWMTDLVKWQNQISIKKPRILEKNNLGLN